MTRRFLVVIGWGLLGLLGVSVVLLALRKELAEEYLEHRLARAGYPDAQLQVTRLGPNGARIRELALLGHGKLTVRRLDIDYAFPAFIRGHLGEVELTGVRARLDLARPQGGSPILSWLPGLDRSKGSVTSSEARSGLTLPSVRFRDVRVAIHTGQGRVGVGLEGWLHPGAGEGWLQVEVREGRSAKAGSLIIGGAGWREGETGRLNFWAEANLAAGAWEILGGASGYRGQAEAVGRFRGRLPSSPPKRRGADALLRLLTGSDLAGAMDLKLAGGGYKDRAGGIEARIEAGFRREKGGLELHLREPVRLSAGKLLPEALTAWGLPRALAVQLTNRRQLRLAPSGSSRLLQVMAQDDQVVAEGKGLVWVRGGAGGPLKADLKGALRLGPDWEVIGFEAESVTLIARELNWLGYAVDSARFSGTLSGSGGEVAGRGVLHVRMERLASPAGAWRDLAFELPLEGMWQASGLVQLRVRDSNGHLSVRPPKGVPRAAQAPLRLTLEVGQLHWSSNGQVKLSLHVLPRPLELSLAPEEGAPFDVTLRPGPLRLKAVGGPEQALHGTLLVGASAIAVPAWGVEAEGLTAKVTGKGDRARIRLDLGRLRSTAQPPWFAPLRGRMDFWARRGAALALGKVGPPGRDPLLDLRARLWPSNGSSHWELVLDAPEMAFQETKLQPGDLSPRLKDLEAVQGGLSAEARLAPRSQRAQIRLRELSFQLPPIRVEGLSGALALDRLLPPTTASGQRFSAQRIVFGLLPLTEARIRYRLEPGSGALPALRIQRAQACLFGGQLRVADARLDVGATEPKVTLRIRDLDLGALFERMGIEGLSGSGRLSGKIPLKLVGGKVRIDGGRLRANGPGVLRYRSKVAKRALGERGEQIQLVLRALEDFRYDKLSVTLRRPTDGNFRVHLSTLGRNPDVLGGTPFQFNINVQGDVGPWVRSLLQGRKFPEGLLKRALEIQRP